MHTIPVTLQRPPRSPFAHPLHHAGKLALFLALCSALAPLLAQAQERHTGPAVDASAERAEAKREASRIKERAAAELEAQRPPPWSQAERRFLQSALAVGRFGAEAGRIGVDRATDPAVKNLAQKLAFNHEALQGALQELARSRDFILTAAPSSSDPQSLQRLRKAGGDFDTVFVREAGVQAQQRAVQLFEKARADSRDTLLQPWLETQLLALRDQLSEAQRIPLRHAPDRTPNSSHNQPTAPPRGP